MTGFDEDNKESWSDFKLDYVIYYSVHYRVKRLDTMWKIPTKP